MVWSIRRVMTYVDRVSVHGRVVGCEPDSTSRLEKSQRLAAACFVDQENLGFVRSN